MQKLYVVTVINQVKGMKGKFYLSDKEGLMLTDNIENAYLFKCPVLAKKFVNEVEGNYPEYDLVVYDQEVVISAEGIELNSVEESQTSEIISLLDGKILSKNVINGDFFNEPLLSAEAVTAPKENELQQLITVDLLGVITRIAELSVGEFSDYTQEQRFVNSLKRIAEAEINLAYATVNLLKKC